MAKIRISFIEKIKVIWNIWVIKIYRLNKFMLKTSFYFNISSLKIIKRLSNQRMYRIIFKSTFKNKEIYKYKITKIEIY